MLGVQASFIGDAGASSGYFEESLKLLRKGADPWRLASLLNNLGYLAHQRADASVPARELVGEAVGLARETGDPWMICIVLESLATIEFDANDHRQAREHWTECLTIARELGDMWQTSYLVEGMARLLIAEHDVETAVELLGAAGSMREATGARREPPVDTVVAKSLADTRQVLGDDKAEQAMRRGSQMSADDAIARALEASAALTLSVR